jgi:deoxyadenosine/deoxycytidine kinase
MSDVCVGVEGLIGVGKSTLCRSIEGLNPQEFSIQLEEVPQSLLALFYSDPSTHAFAFQLYMFNQRLANFKIQNERFAARHITPLPRTIFDRTVFGDRVFAVTNYVYGNMTKQQYDTYSTMWEQAMNGNETHVERTKRMKIVFLNARPSEVLRRVEMRGNPAEKGIQLEYMNMLYRVYFNMIMCMIEVGYPVYVLSWNDLGDVLTSGELIADLDLDEFNEAEVTRYSDNRSVFEKAKNALNSSTDESAYIKHVRLHTTLRYYEPDVDVIFNILEEVHHTDRSHKVARNAAISCWFSSY